VANLIYYTCHIPTMCFIFLFITKDSKFGATLFMINTVLYSLWLILITIGILWNNLQKRSFISS
jgi:hypothetical protein